MKHTISLQYDFNRCHAMLSHETGLVYQTMRKPTPDFWAIKLFSSYKLYRGTHEKVTGRRDKIFRRVKVGI